MDAPATRTDTPLADGAAPAQHGVNVAPVPAAATPSPATATRAELESLMRSQHGPYWKGAQRDQFQERYRQLIRAEETGQPQGAPAPQAEPAPEIHAEHNFDLRDIPADAAPLVHRVANVLHGMGASQQDAERASKVAQQIQAEDAKADQAVFEHTRATMQSELGDEFAQITERMNSFIKSEHPSIQPLWMLMASLHPEGFRRLRAVAETAPRDIAADEFQPQPAAPAAPEPSSRSGYRDAIYVRGDRRRFMPS